MRLSEKIRFRWALKPSEINFKQFIEGKHVVNHLSNSSLLTNKFKFFKALLKLRKSLKSKTIQSDIYTTGG